MPLPEYINQFLSTQNFSGTEKILVAVSGGLDSMVLIHAMHQQGVNIHAAHVHHGKRVASDEEENFVSEWCSERNIGLTIKHLQAEIKPANTNFQDWARQARYAFFKETAQKENCDFIATAHHLNDKVETFFGHALRGSGVNGLSSLRAREGIIIRPMLTIPYAEIQAYSNAHKLEWREDESNATDNYQRNRIRHHVLPALNEVKGDWQAGFENTLTNLEEERLLLHDFVNLWKEKHTKSIGPELHVDLNALSNASSPKALLYHALVDVDTGFNWEALANAEKDAVGSYYYGLSHRALRDRERLIISPISDTEVEEVTITASTQKVDKPVELAFYTLYRDQQTNLKQGIANTEKTFSPAEALLDFDKLTFPLTLRKWQNGDKFMPLGMKGMKLVSDYLINKKMPRTQKEKTLVMVSNDRIVWLVGQRIDERFKVGVETQKMYLARLQNFDES